MDQTLLSLFSTSLLFYWHYQQILKWTINRVPVVPPLTEPFKKISDEIIELERVYPQQHLDSVLQPLHICTGTIIVEHSGPVDPFFHHFIGRMLGEPI